ncbi:acyl-CoA Delta-9 desaturase [Anastrepha obliqua]|uniref:acyl-CoA Delta-9 desaturase n=1 Tax=Anastrepha obliqua TaxID=95512 RepID=UPI00240A0EE3|nr:acyl-CoA Delta-9 desaturase [Anastrepha obliqua]XP_054736907.1 acyl-CoA Delta-9 desaturase [Anastrepha obliqua]XP_054736917.1 acyl-CoA Delta-9 desaturase [Anastrepha obliqua]
METQNNFASNGDIQRQQQQQQQPQTSATTADTSTHFSQRIKREASWPSVLFYIHLNILGLYGIFVMFTSASFLTILFTLTLTFLGILGATAGAHRLWAHQTYTASTSLRIFLMLCQTLAGQGTIYGWVQAHRLHHQKFRQEDDIFYSARNFMAAQVHAQIMSYTPEQQQLLNEVDMSDIEEDKIVMFQKKYYWVLYFFLHVLLPVNAPLEYWGDSIAASIFVTFSLRYLIVLNVCWLINSAHFIWGLDKNFKPSDSNSVFFITKSYWPQYHYLLPNDYQSGEFGDYGTDFTTAIIRVFAALDMASDLRTISSVAVRKGLTAAVETGRPIVECIQEQAAEEFNEMPKNHFLNRERFM